MLVSSSGHAFPLSSSNPFSQQVKFFQPPEAVTSSSVSPFLWPSWEAKYYFFNPGLTVTFHGQLPSGLQTLA